MSHNAVCWGGREGEEGTAWGNMVPIDFSQNWKDWCNSVLLEIMHRAALVSSCAQWIKFGTETLFWGEAVKFASLWLLRFWHLGDFIFSTVEIIYQNPCNSDARYRRCLFLCLFFPAPTPFYILFEVQRGDTQQNDIEISNGGEQQGLFLVCSSYYNNIQLLLRL